MKHSKKFPILLSIASVLLFANSGLAEPLPRGDMMEEDCRKLGKEASEQGADHFVIGYEGLMSCAGNRLKNTFTSQLSSFGGTPAVHKKLCWSAEKGQGQGKRCLKYFKDGYNGEGGSGKQFTLILAGHSFGIQGVSALIDQIGGGSEFGVKELNVVTFDGRFRGNENGYMRGAGTRCVHTKQAAAKKWINFNQDSSLTGICVTGAVNDNWGSSGHVSLPNVTAQYAVCMLKQEGPPEAVLAACGRGPGASPRASYEKPSRKGGGSFPGLAQLGQQFQENAEVEEEKRIARQMDQDGGIAAEKAEGLTKLQVSNTTGKDGVNQPQMLKRLKKSNAIATKKLLPKKNLMIEPEALENKSAFFTLKPDDGETCTVDQLLMGCKQAREIAGEQ